MIEQQLAVDEIVAAPILTPKLAPWMDNIIKSHATMASLLGEYGSPSHIVVASEFRRNVRDLLTPLRERGLAGSLFFARKANKLPWFVSAANEEGIGVDTASFNELIETIQLGIPPQNIISTAIGKEPELINAAIKLGCLLVADNMDELSLITAMAEEQGRTARIGLRFAGFQVDDRKIFSRFGFPIDDFAELIAVIKKSDFLQLDLLHAHLDRYDIYERACAVRQLIVIADYALSKGLKVKSLDLGGGILIRYLAKETDWTRFLSRLHASVAGEQPAFTYRQDGFGLTRAGTKVVGNPELYPAWNDLSKERFISAVLDYNLDERPLSKHLLDRDLSIYFEPGRALLDNVGMTLSKVTYRKRDTDGNFLVGIGMNRMNLRPFRAEFCSDPFFIANISDANTQRKYALEAAFLVGNLCSESDLIYRRKLQLPFMPEPGDICCFANTAGYLAHHMEIGTHGNPLPTNVLINNETFDVLDQHS